MATLKDLSLQTGKEEIINFLKTSDSASAKELSEKIPWLLPKDADCKALIDQAFREYLLQVISVWDVEMLKKYVHLNIELCRSDLSSPNSPVILLSDIFDMSTLEFCENLFSFVEMNVYTWKEDLFFAVCKNHLLRMCNDLLRRLSRSQNTVFCGRILLFLAQFFPFSERSGLNIVSEFNIENITEFNSDGDLEALIDEELEEKDSDTKIKVDFSLYSKFWFLQNFFRCPNDLYANQKWMVFTTYAKFVLSALQHYKLEGGSQNAYMTTLTYATDKDNRYFAKFLTSQKLLELQLSDSNFRRYVLVQFLILFQYLSSTVKSKPDSCTLKPEQAEWISTYKDIVYDLIRETPPDGDHFVNTVEKILQREERWNEWKNKSCPEVRKPNAAQINFGDSEKKEKHLGDILREYSNRRKYFMGNKALTLLWNKKSDNMEACRSADRNFLPTTDDYFKVAVDQADPVAEIEPQYKKVNEMDYAWRGLRLLSQKCPYFFAQSNNPIHKMSDFLENMLNKVIKDKPTVTGNVEEKAKLEVPEHESQDVIINTDGAEDGEAVNDESQNGGEELTEEQASAISKELIVAVAKTIPNDWQKLGLQMGYTKDEIDFFENDRPTENTNAKPTPEEKARYMLQIWSEDDDDPSLENLLSMLEILGLEEAIRAVKESLKDS